MFGNICWTHCTKICNRVKTIRFMIHYCYEMAEHVHHKKSVDASSWLHLPTDAAAEEGNPGSMKTPIKQIPWNFSTISAEPAELIALIQTVLHFHASACHTPSFLWWTLGRLFKLYATRCSHSFAFSLSHTQTPTCFLTIALLLQKQPRSGSGTTDHLSTEARLLCPFNESISAFLKSVNRFLRTDAGVLFGR